MVVLKSWRVSCRMFSSNMLKRKAVSRGRTSWDQPRGGPPNSVLSGVIGFVWMGVSTAKYCQHRVCLSLEDDAKRPRRNGEY
ncbi:hypothetical protein LSAT2_003630 [Lamellibrachia satsuma]|nr:hypothetical protein LSAT2_003630 [Lamellibrachia satsuma]